MSALFNFDKNKLERLEDEMFSIGSIIGQILFPIGLIMFVSQIMFSPLSMDQMMTKILLVIVSLMFTLFGLGATGTALIDSDTIWHRLNKKIKVFGYK